MPIKVTTALKLKTTWIIRTTVVSYKADFIFLTTCCLKLKPVLKGSKNPSYVTFDQAPMRSIPWRIINLIQIRIS